ncbi:MAG: hypothetical protein KGI51_10250 [Rhodospirillales bacterium]|nr:hypothetical protein [Rhodospirillales bacterium]
MVPRHVPTLAWTVALTLGACAAPSPAPVAAVAPRPPPHGVAAVIVAVRPVPPGALGRDPAAFGLAPASASGESLAEFVLREAGGHTRAVIAQHEAGMRIGARVRLFDRGQRIALAGGE